MATVKKKKEKKKINTPAVAEQRVAGPLRTGVLLQWETGQRQSATPLILPVVLLKQTKINTKHQWKTLMWKTTTECKRRLSLK